MFKPRPENYAEMGFESKKSGKPLNAWGALRILATQNGVLTNASDGRSWAKVEKRIQELRRHMKNLFGLTDDPLPFIKKTRRNA